ncbi:MAG: flagellar operon protein [Oscillospiraceae bacterium]|jgi:flagellar operon protein|nr:flagellar operon protein [Oscillospiraceae bacterium]
MNNIQFQRNYSAATGPVYGIQPSPAGKKQQVSESRSSAFAQALQTNLQKSGGTQLTFSKHAIQRMDSRKIEVSPALADRIGGAVQRADSKGVKEALILSGSTAFIVHVPSRTVVTTMDSREMKENIFTHIDGAVIL